MYVKTLHYSQMLINVYEINVLTVKILLQVIKSI